MRTAYLDEYLLFDDKTGRFGFDIVETEWAGKIWPGKKPLPLRRADGSYDTSICHRYDELMEDILQLAYETSVIYFIGIICNLFIPLIIYIIFKKNFRIKLALRH